MRTSSAAWLALAAALAACGEPRADRATLAKVEAEQSRAQDDAGDILCAERGAATLTRVCTLDRAETAAGLVLTVRHPDGAFHRLLVTRDGRGVVAADGAERARVSIVGTDAVGGGEIEVTLGGDRYRLPATVRSGATRS